MFDRFTDRARKVIVYSQEEAKLLCNNYIGTEHILLGIMRESDGVGAKSLKTMSITLEEVRSQVRETSGIQTYRKPQDHIPFTPKAKQVLELSLKEAVRLDSNYIGTEHLLLGLLKVQDSIAIQVIRSLGTTPEDLEAIILDQLGFVDEEEDSVLDGLGPHPFDMREAEEELIGTFPNAKPRRNSRKSTLELYAENLTEKAKNGEFDPVVGRDDVISRIIQVLSRRKKNNPVLLGDPGVGKTAVLEGIAQQIATNKVPGTLAYKQIYGMNMTSLLAGTHFRGDFEVRMKQIIAEATERNDVILFFDEIHMMVGAGAVDGGSMDAGNILKPLLASGDIKIIGATTYEEYRKYFEKDSALERRFQPIQIKEPTLEYSVKILNGIKSQYEKFHKVKYSKNAIKDAVVLSNRYITDRFLPDKAIDLLDEAGSRMKVTELAAPPQLNKITSDLETVLTEKEIASSKQNFEQAAKLRDKEKKLKAKYKELEKKWRNGDVAKIARVNSELIAKLVSEQTGIPVYKMTEAESARLLRMEDELHKRVIGQNEAISALCRSIRRTRSGLKDPKRPAGSFIFAGPTGVGKTELAKTLTHYLFDNEDALIRLDMSEYSTPGDVSKLFGSAPGFVGYDEGGQLTEKVRRNPFSVVLFDEIEKAHSQIFNSLLQILDEGHLTDSHGKNVNFKNTIIIMTTNIGAEQISNKNPLGFSDDSNKEATYNQIKSKVNSELKKKFRPEFLNRLDDIIIFSQLSEVEVLQVLDLMIDRVNDRLKHKNIVLQVSSAAKKLLATIAYEPTLGARPLLRAIQREIEDPISEKILTEEIKDGDVVKVELDKGVKTKDISLSDLYDITKSHFIFEIKTQNKKRTN
jgi:ATP-dependent Clp protease ATP-binding subunit ClpC